MNRIFKVLLVEDHELTREGIRYNLKKLPNFEIAGEAIDGKEAIELFKKFSPNVVLMDIALPVLNGIEATRIIKSISPETKVIMLTSYGDKEKVFGAFSAGADAYCMKDIKITTLVKVIETVMDGGVWLDTQIANLILNVLPLFSKQSDKMPEYKHHNWGYNVVLTSREKEILTLIAAGFNNKEVADKLNISIYTVKNHVSNIINKLAVEDRTQAVILAIKEGLI